MHGAALVDACRLPLSGASAFELAVRSDLIHIGLMLHCRCRWKGLQDSNLGLSGSKPDAFGRLGEPPVTGCEGWT